MTCETMEREAARYRTQCQAHEEGVGVKDAEPGKVFQGQRCSGIIDGKISYTQLRRRRRRTTSSMYKRNHHIQNQHDHPEPSAYYRRQFRSRRPRRRRRQQLQIAPSREDKSQGRRSNATRHLQHDAQVTGNQCNWIGWIGQSQRLTSPRVTLKKK